jgi:hypothetical protein
MRKVPKAKQALSSFLFPACEYFTRACCSCLFPVLGRPKFGILFKSAKTFYLFFLQVACRFDLAPAGGDRGGKGKKSFSFGKGKEAFIFLFSFCTLPVGAGE